MSPIIYRTSSPFKCDERHKEGAIETHTMSYTSLSSTKLLTDIILTSQVPIAATTGGDGDMLCLRI